MNMQYQKFKSFDASWLFSLFFREVLMIYSYFNPEFESGL